MDVCGALIAEGRKRWILVITDLVIRAIELELLEDLTEEELLYAYQHFVSCHSPTLYFVLDNAPQFELLHKLSLTTSNMSSPGNSCLPSPHGRQESTKEWSP